MRRLLVVRKGRKQGGENTKELFDASKGKPKCRKRGASSAQWYI